MKSFEFEALDIAGTTYKGIVQANSGEEAILKLAQQKIYPKSVSEMSPTQLATTNRILNLKRMKAKLTGNEAPQQIKEPEISKVTFDWSYLIFVGTVITTMIIYFVVR